MYAEETEHHTIKTLNAGKLGSMQALWVGHQHRRALPISTIIIQAKAKSLFENLNIVDSEPEVRVICLTFKRRSADCFI
jgi:hypothetical protein